jgi:hypothetical protein
MATAHLIMGKVMTAKMKLQVMASGRLPPVCSPTVQPTVAPRQAALKQVNDAHQHHEGSQAGADLLSPVQEFALGGPMVGELESTGGCGSGLARFCGLGGLYGL